MSAPSSSSAKPAVLEHHKSSNVLLSQMDKSSNASREDDDSLSSSKDFGAARARTGSRIGQPSVPEPVPLRDRKVSASPSPINSVAVLGTSAEKRSSVPQMVSAVPLSKSNQPIIAPLPVAAVAAASAAATQTPEKGSAFGAVPPVAPPSPGGSVGKDQLTSSTSSVVTASTPPNNGATPPGLQHMTSSGPPATPVSGGAGVAGFHLRRNTAHLVEKLKDRPKAQLDRESEWRKNFELPEADLLVGDFAAAAFVKGVPRHGRLFVFTDHLCFHSVLFGQKTQIVIPFADVIGVEKTVENLTPGMKVRTNTKSYKFGSLYSRPKSHEMINSVWKGSYVIVEDDPDASLNGGSIASEAETEALERESSESNVVVSASEYHNDDGFLHGVDELTELLTDELPVSPVRFFQLFVSNESTFEEDYHKARGDTDIKVGKWSPHAQFGNTRDVFYVLKLSGPIGPPTSRTEEIHRYHLSKERLIIDTSMQMADAPYGDYFRVESQWIVTQKDENKSTIKISAKAVFSKSTIMKGTISSRTLAGMTESFTLWIKLAKELINKKANKDSPAKGGKSSPELALSSSGEARADGGGASGASASTSFAASRTAAGAAGHQSVAGQIVSAVLQRENINTILLVLNLLIFLYLIRVLWAIERKL